MRRFTLFHEIYSSGAGFAVTTLPFVSHEEGRAVSSEIRVGQRYKKLDAFATLWEVDDWLPEAGAVPHVRLRSVIDPLVTRSISASTLRNERFYQLVTPPSDPDPSPPRG